MRDKELGISPVDLLDQLNAERERIARTFLETNGCISPEDQNAVMSAAIESMPEGSLQDFGRAIVALNQRADDLAAQRKLLASKAINSMMESSDSDIDGAIADLYIEAGRLKADEGTLQAEIDRCRSALSVAHSELDGKAALDDAARAFESEREKLSDFAAQVIAKTLQSGFGAIISSSPTPTPTQDAKTPLSRVLEAYCENQRAEGSWTPKTELENRAIYDLWIRIVGDQPIGTYGYDQHRTYKSTLLKLPPNLNKSPRYRGRTIEEIVALGNTPAAPNTINKALTRIAAFFKWAVGYGYTAFNPAGAMNIKNPKRANEERQAFTEDDLRRLFHTPEYLERKHRFPYMHWSPLIALYSGARINEIAQLHTADFRVQDGNYLRELAKS